MTDNRFLSSASAFQAQVTLNVGILSIFFTGAYTMLYIGTMRIYLKNKSSRAWRPFVMAAITTMYILNVIQTVVGWIIISNQFSIIVKSGSVDDLLISAWPDIAMLVISDVVVMLTSILADLILVWRCYFLWGRSFRIVSIPIGLLIAEACIDIRFLQCQYGENQTVSRQELVQNLFSGSMYITFAITLLTTTLIVYRLILLSSSSYQSGSTKTVKVIELVIQSSALYAITSLLFAVSVTLNSLPSGHTRGSYNAFCQYMSDLYSFFAGASATIMVARVSALNSKNSFADDIVFSNSAVVPYSQISLGRAKST